MSIEILLGIALFIAVIVNVLSQIEIRTLRNELNARKGQTFTWGSGSEEKSK